METILNAVLAVFTGVIDWFITSMNSVVALFYSAETGLTFFGVMALIALGISLVLLFIRMVKNYLTFRG